MTDNRAYDDYRTFADFVASDSDLSIFRRFDCLNAKNLLYLQSELLSLEDQIDQLDEEDLAENTLDTMLTARCWEVLASRAKDSPREAERMKLIKDTRETLERYNRALAQRAELLTFSKPGKRAFRAYSNWFQEAKPFNGIARKRLLEDESDFVALKKAYESDRLTEAFVHATGIVVSWFKRGPVVYYSEEAARRVVDTISIVGAVLILEVAIVALYVVTNNHIRLGLVALFTSLFAATLTVFSNARRAEMFAATAAYAAVLVVFLSGNLSNSPT